MEENQTNTNQEVVEDYQQVLLDKVTHIDDSLSLYILSQLSDSQQTQEQEEQQEETTQIIDYTSLITTLNNNVVNIGSSIIFLISVLIGVSLGKVLKLWKS